MPTERINCSTGTGRLVEGSLYRGQDTDLDGKKLIDKDGVPYQLFYVALAVRKKPGETSWKQTKWGQEIYAMADNSFRDIKVLESPSFAWKIEDGDDDKLFNNRNQPRKRANKEKEGFAGCWILKFNTRYKPTIHRWNDQKTLVIPFNEEEAIQLGSYVQINFSAIGNDQIKSPGIFLSHEKVCYIQAGPLIKFALDANEVGFTYEPAEGGLDEPQAPGDFTQHVTPAPQQTVQPYREILNVSSDVPPPPAPPVSLTPTAHLLKFHPEFNKDGKGTKEAFLKKGWSEEQLIQYGLI